MLFTIMAGVVAFVLTVVGIPVFIKQYQKAKIGGQQTHEDVKQHQAKAGTPTMGGLVFLVAGIVTSLIFLSMGGHLEWSTLGILVVTALYGIVGFLDDFLKVFRQINEGLNPKQKLFLQILGGIIFYGLDTINRGTSIINFFGYNIVIGWLSFFFILFWLVGFSNAVNLTDGIDGLASVSVVISLITYGIIAIKQGQLDIFIIIISMIGALLGFFVFNHKPAKVFMGDVGSLALGGMLATLSLALNQEWTLLLIGLVYVLETSSVMLQVGYFKYTRKKTGEGKRIFRMTPLHHHLELGGLSGKGKPWGEWKVDAFLWGVGILVSIVTLIILYI